MTPSRALEPPLEPKDIGDKVDVTQKHTRRIKRDGKWIWVYGHLDEKAFFVEDGVMEWVEKMDGGWVLPPSFPLKGG